MFKFIRKKKNDKLTVAKLIRTLRDIRLSNAIIEEPEYMSAKGYNKIILKLDKVNIIDIIKINLPSKEEEHDVEIELIDKSNELIVYKSPTVYVKEEDSGKLLIEVNEEFSLGKTKIKNNVVKWSIKGNWCEYILSKVNELELEINRQKLRNETEKIKREEEVIREKSDKVRNFNNLFKED